MKFVMSTNSIGKWIRDGSILVFTINSKPFQCKTLETQTPRDWAREEENGEEGQTATRRRAAKNPRRFHQQRELGQILQHPRYRRLLRVVRRLAPTPPPPSLPPINRCTTGILLRRRRSGSFLFGADPGPRLRQFAAL